MKMSRFTSCSVIIAALAIGVLLTVFTGSTAVTRPSTTIVSVHDVSSTSPTTVTSTQATSTQTVSVPKKIVSPSLPKNSSASTPASVTPEVPAASPTPPTPTDNNLINASAASLRGALVNILCYVPAGSNLHSISGSGVFIDPKGIILTNAHVAQYFLLADHSVSCSIRSGSPATNQYTANLIYISPVWLKANATILTEDSPNGTGEYDFAFLAVSKSTTSTPLPTSFPYLPLSTTPPTAGTSVVIASYGAQFLESNQISSALFPTIVFGSVKDVFTFAVNTIDVLALGGSAAAQEGSSGGGVADASGNLVGTITTSTVSGATDTRSLDAITASYIRAEYASETGRALDLFLSKPTATDITSFASQEPSLESIITAQLH